MLNMKLHPKWLLWLTTLLAAHCALATSAEGTLVRRLFKAPHGYTAIRPWGGELILRMPGTAPYTDRIVLYDPETNGMTFLAEVPREALGPWIDPFDDRILLFARDKSLLSLDPRTATLTSKDLGVALSSISRIVGHRIYMVTHEGKFEVANELNGAIESSGALPQGYRYGLRWDGALIGTGRDRIIVGGPHLTTAPIEFQYNANSICDHSNFQEFGQFLIVQANCGSLTIFDRTRGAAIAVLHPGNSGEISFVVSRGLIFTLPWGAQSGGPPEGRVYEAATGRELASYTAGGQLLAVTADRLVTSESVYALDRSQLSPAARNADILHVFPAAQALAARDHTPYRAIELLDDSGMSYLAEDILDRRESVDTTLRPIIEQYARWLAQTVTRYHEARALIEQLRGPKSGSKGLWGLIDQVLHPESARSWERILARLYHLDAVLQDDGSAETVAKQLDPSGSYARPDAVDTFRVAALPSDLIQPWTGPLMGGWNRYVETLRDGVVFGNSFVMPSDVCSFNVYSAATLKFQRSIPIDRCDAFAGSQVTAVTAGPDRLYVLLSVPGSTDEANEEAASTVKLKLNLVVYDSTTFRELARYIGPSDASKLYVAGHTLLECRCEIDISADDACMAYPLDQEGHVDVSHASQSTSPIANLGCDVGRASPGSAARAIPMLASGGWSAGEPEGVDDSYFAIRSARPGASGYFAVDIRRLAPPHAVVSEQLPFDAYTFLGFLPGHDNLAFVQRDDRDDHVYAVFDIVAATLHPILDVPDRPLDDSTTRVEEVVTAGDWLVAAVGREVLLRRISSPGIVYVASDFGGGPDSWLRVFPSAHWVMVDVHDRRESPKPVVILLDPLSRDVDGSPGQAP